MAYSKENLSRTDTVYMLITDRFYDGDPSNNGKLGSEYQPGNLHFYQGGDWNGILKKLPYIKSLGFTAIWISAPQDNELFSRTGDEAGYHGYYTRDFNSPNPHFGTQQDLKKLIDEADKLGLKVIIDVQLNHTADYLEYPSMQYDPPWYRPAPPFDNPEWYHNNPNIINFEDPYEAQNYSLGGLDDLAQENPECWKALMEAYWKPESNSGWFSYGFAGSRVDAVVEIPPEYLARYEKHTGKHCFGEAFTGSVQENAFYQKYLWGMLDYPLYFQINNAICLGNDWTGIRWVFNQDDLYMHPQQLFTFIDNHDRSRFLANCADNVSKLHLALALIYAARGIPVFYYGTEQHMAGDFKYTEETINYYNREMMTGFNVGNRTFAYTQRLNWIRKEYSDILADGDQEELYYRPGDPVYSFKRKSQTGNNSIICVFNNSPVKQSRNIYISRALGKIYTNLLNTNERFVFEDNVLNIQVPAYSALLLTSDGIESYIPEKVKRTKIVINYNAGWGNSIYIRGDTLPLSWNFGQKCDNVHESKWVFELERPSCEQIKFKVLINDVVWQSGEDIEASVGSEVVIWPQF